LEERGGPRPGEEPHRRPRAEARVLLAEVEIQVVPGYPDGGSPVLRLAASEIAHPRTLARQSVTPAKPATDLRVTGPRLPEPQPAPAPSGATGQRGDHVGNPVLA